MAKSSDAFAASGQMFGISDPDAFARNLALVLTEAGDAATAYLKPRESAKAQPIAAEELAEVVRTLMRVAEYWAGNPQRWLEAQNRIFTAYFGLWTSVGQRTSSHTDHSSMPSRLRLPSLASGLQPQAVATPTAGSHAST